MKTIAVINRKGGVAKTATAQALGAAIKKMGFSVVYVDLDSQANLTYALGADSDMPGAMDLLTGSCSTFDAIQETPQGYVIAGSEETYTGNVRQFIKWTRQNGIQRPARADVIQFREDLRARCKPTTVQNYITALRLFFQWTEQAGLYPNIAARVKGAKLDTAHKKDYLTAYQLRVILQGIDTSTAKGQRDYGILSLMITGGLRDVEVSRANIDDLRQLGAGTVLYLQGKGHEERTDYVKVVQEVETALRAYLRTRPAAHGQQPLFASMSNNSRGRRLSPKSISAIVKHHFIEAGYNSERLTAHSLRHSAVTLSLLGGLPLEEVQQFARHRNITTTQIYAHNLDRAKNRSEDTIARSIFDL